MRLKCRIDLGAFILDIDVSFESQVTSIFGPSGAGKTSLLDAIAGLRKLQSGEIEVAGRTLFSSSLGIDLSPQERAVGYLPQEAALFPHLSVRKNILFGSRRGGRDNRALDIRFEHVASLLEIDHLLDRPATSLSGGESQRVALARAILSRPLLLLLDEPLASLDVGLKERILPYLRRVRDQFSIPMIYVTHDPIEVLSLADWVVMIEEGRLVTQGSPRDVLSSALVLPHLPEHAVENVFNARLEESDYKGGRSRVRLESGQELFIPLVSGPLQRPLQIRVRGDDILVATRRPEGISAGNVLVGRIAQMESLEGESILRVQSADTFNVRLTPSAIDRLRLVEGMEVFLIIKARSCAVL